MCICFYAVERNLVLRTAWAFSTGFTSSIAQTSWLVAAARQADRFLSEIRAIANLFNNIFVPRQAQD